MAVAGTVVLGHITDDVFVPAFAGHRDGGKVAWAVAATILIAAARSVGVVTRRYSAAITSRRMQVTLRTAIAERFLAVPMSWVRAKSTGELLAHADNEIGRASCRERV